MKRSANISIVATLAAAVFACASCGGGSGSTASSPTTPTSTPTPSPPAGGVCSVLGGASGVSLGIVNGTACSSNNSSVVLVNLRDKGGNASASCSGTVIAPRAVLTAAHCLVGDTAAASVYPGSGVPVLATSLMAFPGYQENSTSSPDVGVILTAEDLPRTPIPLLVSRPAQIGESAVIAGWGKDQFGNGTTLRAGMTSIAAVGTVMLETRYSSTTSAVCSGDSGGALLLSEGGAWVLAGVTSAVTQSGSCVGGTNYYTSVWNPDVLAFITGLVPGIARR